MNIGDWCIFQKDHQVLIGHVLSFSYLDGKSFKEQSFVKSTAPLESKKAIGVLCNWYYWKDDGQLNEVDVKKHNFNNIQFYLGTIPRPTFHNKFLMISTETVYTLNDEVITDNP